MPRCARLPFGAALSAVALTCCLQGAVAARVLQQQQQQGFGGASFELQQQQPQQPKQQQQQQQQLLQPQPNDAFAFGNYDPGYGGGGGGLVLSPDGGPDEPLRLSNAHRHIIKHLVNHHEKLKQRNPDLRVIVIFFALVIAAVCVCFIRAYYDLHGQAMTRIIRAKNAEGEMIRSELRARERSEAADSWMEVSQLVQRGKVAREEELRAEFAKREREMREEFSRDKERMAREARSREAELRGKNALLSRAVETSERIIAEKSDEIARAKRGC